MLLYEEKNVSFQSFMFTYFYLLRSIDNTTEEHYVRLAAYEYSTQYYNSLLGPMVI